MEPLPFSLAGLFVFYVWCWLLCVVSVCGWFLVCFLVCLVCRCLYAVFVVLVCVGCLLLCVFVVVAVECRLLLVVGLSVLLLFWCGVGSACVYACLYLLWAALRNTKLDGCWHASLQAEVHWNNSNSASWTQGTVTPKRANLQTPTLKTTPNRSPSTTNPCRK